jgi:hypothetical protein
MDKLKQFQEALEQIPDPSPALRAYIEAGRRYLDTKSDAAFDARIEAWEKLTAEELATVKGLA